MGDMDGKVAVITGAGSGMAKACTQLFVQEGAKVVAADISGREKDTASELGDSVLPVHCDVSEEDDVVAMFEAAAQEFGRVDAVLNVAGRRSRRPSWTCTSGSWPSTSGVSFSARSTGSARFADPEGAPSSTGRR
jgi:NAD(P)-dependent dehydrogenase (short-subunit alcohol dehydrogenase family)